MNHSLIVIEAFLLALLGRKAYRRDETHIEGPVNSIEAGFSPFETVTEQPQSSSDISETKKSLANYGSMESDEISTRENDNGDLSIADNIQNRLETNAI